MPFPVIKTYTNITLHEWREKLNQAETALSALNAIKLEIHASEINTLIGLLSHQKTMTTQLKLTITGETQAKYSAYLRLADFLKTDDNPLEFLELAQAHSIITASCIGETQLKVLSIELSAVGRETNALDKELENICSGSSTLLHLVNQTWHEPCVLACQRINSNAFDALWTEIQDICSQLKTKTKEELKDAYRSLIVYLSMFDKHHIDSTTQLYKDSTKLKYLIASALQRLEQKKQIIQRTGQYTKEAIDLNVIQNILLEFFPKIEDVKFVKDLILVIGNSGDGKSTLINYLLGCEMDKNHDGLEIKAIPRYPYKEFAKIGRGISAKTTFPAVYSEPVSDSDTNHFYFADLPGFEGNRTTEETVCESISTEYFISSAKNIRGVIVAIDVKAFTAHGDGISKLVDTLNKFMRLTPEVLPSMLFVITQTTEQHTKEKIILTINKLIGHENKKLKSLKQSNQANSSDEVFEKKWQDSVARLAILSLMVENPDNLIISNVFDDFETRKKIFSRLTSLASAPTIPKDIFNFSRYNDSRMQFNNLVHALVVKGEQVLRERKTLPKVMALITNRIFNLKASINTLETFIKSVEDYNCCTPEAMAAQIQRIVDMKENNNNSIKNYAELVRSYQDKYKELTRELHDLDSTEEYPHHIFSPKPSWLRTSLRTVFLAELSTAGLFSMATFGLVVIRSIEYAPKHRIDGAVALYGLATGTFFASLAADFGHTKFLNIFFPVTLNYDGKGVPYSRVITEAQHGQFIVVTDEPQSGKYEARFYREANILSPEYKVTLLGEKRLYPPHAARISVLQIEIKKVRADIEAAKADINRLEEENASLNKLIAGIDNRNLYKSMLTQYKEELVHVESDLDKHLKKQKEAEEQIENNKGIYLSIAAICKQLKMDSVLIRPFLEQVENSFEPVASIVETEDAFNFGGTTYRLSSAPQSFWRTAPPVLTDSVTPMSETEIATLVAKYLSARENADVEIALNRSKIDYSQRISIKQQLALNAISFALIASDSASRNDNGNCFYNALEHQLVLGINANLPCAKLDSQTLRERVTQHIITHLNQYQDNIEGVNQAQAINDFIDNISSLGNWADHIEAQAFADMTGTSLCIIRSDDEVPTIIEPSEAFQDNNKGNFMFLGYEENLHYLSLIQEPGFTLQPILDAVMQRKEQSREYQSVCYPIVY
ncbi:TPA: hypothetical protein JBF89_15380 [Legionella pneumophila]|nr:hypothetical protein [Legionella pneumophila]HAU0352114.1 hypothetical protein [Legionella pneumophila]HAU0355290.1 hypothetical protein [Legionella pneumophila]HAU0361459.1 hypothetical protein [Legionella pneumophila]HAU0370234.1 hypothetical protein [Legionella pneumophila]